MLQPFLRFALRSIPDRAAARLTISMANRSIRSIAGSVEQAALAAATRLGYGPEGKLSAWSWGQGPCVVLVHGWGGSAAQMAPLAMTIASAGFRSIALDITGHGASPGRSTAWSFFVRDIEALAQTLDVPIHAYVGHSAGGLATMAARKQGRVDANKFVCIASPSYPYPPVRAALRRLNPRPGAINHFQHYLAKELGFEWQELEDGAAFRGIGSNVLLIYDKNDKYVDHTQADMISACSVGSTVLKTDKYSHTRILTAKETADAVCEFLARKS